MAIRLHVIYAGRGDAFVIEDGDKLILLDAGPRGYNYSRQDGAPYYRYVLAALREVSASMNRGAPGVTLDAVIASHADEDHYGGIKRLFDEMLSPQFAVAPTAASPLVFNGPFITQPLVDREQPGQADVLDLLEDNAFTEILEPASPAWLRDGYKTHGAKFYRRTAAPVLGRAWDVDTSPNNLASVLMYQKSRRMVFTGDSVGHLVAPFVDHGDVVKPLSIFKVPHHGSMRNSQLTDLGTIVCSGARYEYALMSLLAGRKDLARLDVPGKWRQSGPRRVATRELTALLDRERLRRAEVFGPLFQKFDDTIARLAAGNDADYLTPVFDWSTRVYRELIEKLKNMAIMGAYTPAARRVQRRGHAGLIGSISGDWLSDFRTPARQVDKYAATAAYGQLTAFYASFAAYNYVISADGTYRHPSVETLAAIATAARNEGRTAQVWVTDAASVDLDGVSSLAPRWAQSMTIRHLAPGRTRMTLDVSNLANAANPALLDPQQTAVVLAASAVGAVALHDQFQTNPSARIPERALLGDEAHTVQLVSSGVVRSLAIAASGLTSMTTAPVAAQKFRIDEAWAIGANDFSRIRLRDVDSGHGMDVYLRPGGGGYAIELSNGWLRSGSFITKTGGTTTDRTSADIAAFTFPKFQLGLTSAAGGHHLAALGSGSPQPLRDYCLAAGLPTSAAFMATALLDKLLGEVDAAGLIAGISPHVLLRVMGWTVDFDTSTVTWTTDGEGPLVTAADLIITLGTPLTFTIDEDTETIASARLTLQPGESDGTITLTVAVRSTTGVDVDDDATVARCRADKLDSWLAVTGLDPTSWPLVTVGAVLSAAAGGDDEAESVMRNAPDLVNLADVAAAMVDHDRSTVLTSRNALGGTDVRRIELVPVLTQTVAAAIAGQTLTLTDLVVTVDDALLPTLLAGFSAKGALGGISDIVVTSELTDGTGSRPAGEMRLALPAGTNLDVLASLLGAEGLDALMVPLAGEALSAADLGLTGLGVTIAQPTAGAGGYEVTSVFGTITYGGWDRFLPIAAPATSSVTVAVFSPLEPANRSVGLDAEFTLAVGTSSLTGSFSAWPLEVSANPDYAYTLGFSAGEEPVTLSAALAAAGFSASVGTPGTALPAISDLADRLALDTLEIELVDTGVEAVPTVAGAVVHLLLSEPWTPLSGLCIRAADVALRLESGSWSGSVAGAVEIGDGAGAILVDARYDLATATAGGALLIQIDGGLTVTAAIGLFASDTSWISAIPVLGPLLDGVALDQIEVLLAPGSSSDVSGVSAGFTIDALEFGSFSLTGLAVDVTRTYGAAASTELAIEATWNDSRIVDVSWSSKTGKISMALRTITPQTVDDLVGVLTAPQTPANALAGAIGQIVVNEAKIVLNSETFSVESFRLDLDPSAVLHLADAAITSLKLSYEAGDTAQAPRRYALEGVISGSGYQAAISIDCVAGESTSVVSASLTSKTLTLSGLATLLTLGALDLPSIPGISTLDVVVSSVAATIEVADAWTLKSLAAQAQTRESVHLFGTVELEQVAGVVRYDATGTAPVLTGAAAATLDVGGVSVSLMYDVDTRGAGTFSGSASTGAGGLDFAQLIASGAFAAGAGQQLPTGEDIPQAIPMQSLEARVQIGTLVEIRGHHDSTDWQLPAGILPAGLGDISVGGVGGCLRIDLAPTVDYDVTLFGSLNLGSSASAIVTFSFDSMGKRILTGALTQPGAADLPGLAGRLAGGSETWAAATPTGTGTIALSDAGYVYLDLVGGVVAVFGNLSGYGTAALISRSGTRAGYVLVGGLGSAFTFEKLWTALAPIDAIINVESANLAVLAYEGTVAELQSDIVAAGRYAALAGVKDFQAPFQNLPALSTVVAPGTTTVAQGTSFYAKLALDREGSGELSDRVGRILNNRAQAPTVVLTASLDHDHPENTTYTAQVADLVLLGGGLQLDGSLAYSPASAGETLGVHGTLTLLEITHDGAPLVFTGDLHVADGQTTFTVGAAPAMIAAPFGMFGISISAPTLTVVFTYVDDADTRVDVELAGGVSLTGLAGLTGRLVFVNGTPALALVAFESLSVLTLFGDIITGGNAGTWPAAYDPVTFKQGSFYGAPAAVTYGGTEYLAGYHLATVLSVFGHDLDVTVDIPADRSGIEVAGGRKLIDLWFIQLTDARFSLKTQGSAVEFYRLTTGISIFDKPFLQTTFTYDVGAQTYKGTAQPPADSPIAELTIGFTWSDADGLQITEFPIPNIDLALDAVKLAKDFGNVGGGCEKLVGLVFQETMSTKVSVDIAQDGKADRDSKKLNLTVTGTYTISGGLPGQTPTELVSFDLPVDVSIDAPESFDIDDIAAWLAGQLAAMSVQILGSLLRQPDKAALFFGALAVGEWGPSVIGSLLCRGIDPPNVVKQANRLQQDGTDEAGEHETEANDAAAEAAGAASMTATAEAVGAAVAAVVGLAAVVEALKKFVDWLSGGDDEQDKLDAARAAEQRARDALAARMTMRGGPTATFATRTSVTVAWTDDNLPNNGSASFYDGFAGFTFEAQVSTTADFSGPNASATTTNQAGRSLTVDLAALDGVTTAYVRLRAHYTGGGQQSGHAPVSADGAWLSAVAVTHTLPLPAPATVTETWQGAMDAITGTVAPVAGAGGYQIDLIDSAHGGAVVASQQLGATALAWSVPAASLPDTVPVGASLLAQARALGDGILRTPSPFVVADASSAVAVADAPSAPDAALDADGIQVSWTAPSSGQTFAVRALDANGQPLAHQPHVAADPDGLGATLYGPELLDGDVVGLERRVVSATGPGAWSRPPTAITLSVLAAPTELAVHFESPAHSIDVTWQATPRAASFDVEVSDQAGQPLSPAPSMAAAGTSGATISGPAVTAGATYRVRVRLTAEHTMSTWSPWLDVAAVDLLAPANLRATLAGVLLTADWDAVTGATDYTVELDSIRAGQPVRTVMSVTSPTAAFASPIDVGSPYTVSVRATAGASIGPSASVSGNVSDLLGLAVKDFEAGTSVADALAACSAAAPETGGPELLATLAGAGYDSTEALAALGTAGFHDLDAVAAALTSPASLVSLLCQDGTTFPTAVELAVANSHVQPLLLVLSLKAIGREQAEIASALPRAYPSIAGADLDAACSVVFVQPWALGAALHAAGVGPVTAIGDLLGAYRALSFIEAMTSFFGRAYDPTSSGSANAAFVAHFDVSATTYAAALMALEDETGFALSALFAGAGESRSTAAAYVASAFVLTPAALAAALNAAYPDAPPTPPSHLEENQ